MSSMSPPLLPAHCFFLDPPAINEQVFEAGHRTGLTRASVRQKGGLPGTPVLTYRGSNSLPKIYAHHLVGKSPELTYFSISQYKR